MRHAVARLFKSRKALLALATIVAAVAARLGLDLDIEVILGVFGVVGTVILGIAYEDGSEKGKTPIQKVTVMSADGDVSRNGTSTTGNGEAP
jgi:hypothetical protein